MEVKKGAWYSFVAFERTRKKRLESGEGDTAEAQTFKAELFFQKNINNKAHSSYPGIQKCLLLKDLKYCKTFWTACCSLNKCEISFLLF